MHHCFLQVMVGPLGKWLVPSPSKLSPKNPLQYLLCSWSHSLPPLGPAGSSSPKACRAYKCQRMFHHFTEADGVEVDPEVTPGRPQAKSRDWELFYLSEGGVCPVISKLEKLTWTFLIFRLPLKYWQIQPHWSCIRAWLNQGDWVAVVPFRRRMYSLDCHGPHHSLSVNAVGRLMASPKMSAVLEPENVRLQCKDELRLRVVLRLLMGWS